MSARFARCVRWSRPSAAFRSSRGAFPSLWQRVSWGRRWCWLGQVRVAQLLVWW
jgi:hypothetical protein